MDSEQGKNLLHFNYFRIFPPFLASETHIHLQLNNVFQFRHKRLDWQLSSAAWLTDIWMIEMKSSEVKTTFASLHDRY